MNRLVNRLFRLSPALLAIYWGALFVGTHYPVPAAAVRLMDHADKIVHFGAYSILAALLAAAWTMRTSLTTWHYAVMAVVLAAYGALDELSQLVPSFHREADVLDWLADAAGIALGLSLFYAARRVAKYRLGLRLEREAGEGAIGWRGLSEAWPRQPE